MIDRDAIIEFIETRKYTLMGIAAAVLLLIALVLGLTLAREDSSEKKKAAREAEMKSLALDRDELFYPAEPLAVPGVQLSRIRKPQWNVEDAKRWYTVPDESAMTSLRSAGLDRIDALLESVP